jgi:hypothetical protein
MRYRRVNVAGATYFFTLVTERRRPAARFRPMLGLAGSTQLRLLQTQDLEDRRVCIAPSHAALRPEWVIPAGLYSHPSSWTRRST